MVQLLIELSYEWQAVYLREKVEYTFPMAITPFMRAKYKAPAIYKWDVYQRAPGDKKLVYIGETQELCPKRLYAYLNPGPTQESNKKINAAFRGYLREKLTIKLEVCDITELKYGDNRLDTEALSDKYIRRMIANAMIFDHRRRGFTVMDL